MTRKIFILFFISFLMVSCHKKEIQYQTLDVAKRTLTKRIEANGSVETVNAVEIYVPVSGRVEQVLVKEGDIVKARQKIAQISSETRSALIDMAAGKSQEELQYWKKQLLLTPIYTPVAGKVILLKADIGEKISGSIGQVSTGEIIRANLDEADLPNVTLGQRVEIHFDISPKDFIFGKLEKISEVSKLVNNVNVYQVEVSLPPEEKQKKIPFDIKIGMSVTLYFRVNEKKDALALPASVVNGRSQEAVNLLKADGTTAKVKLGDIYGDWVEVVSGLHEGEKVKVPVFESQRQKARKSPLMINKE